MLIFIILNFCLKYTIITFLIQIFLSNRFEDRYLSPLSHIIATIRPFYNVFAKRTAAAIEPPLLTPANIASYFANLKVIYYAYCWDTYRIWSTRLLSNILGKYSGAHLLIPGILAVSSGWTPTIWIYGFFYFKNILVPIIVPVVPIDATKWVIFYWVSR